MEQPPICTSCNHHHEQGVRCSICGHVGKSQIFMKMRMKANERRAYHSEVISYAMCHTNVPVHDLLSSMLPTQYPQLTSEVAFMILSKGDCIVGAAAFTLVSSQSMTHVLLIPYMHIIPEYRGSKYSYYILYNLIQLSINNHKPPAQIALATGIPMFANDIRNAGVDIGVQSASLVDKLVQEGLKPNSSLPISAYALSIEGKLAEVMGYLQAKYKDSME